MKKLQPKLVALAAALALAGCASGPAVTWRVEPVSRTVHAGSTGSAQGWLALARQYEGELRHAQALEAYRKAAQEAPYDAELLNRLGVAEAAQGDRARAMSALRSAAVLAPGRAHIVNNLGYALQLEGQVDEARRMFRLALAIDPGYALARQNLAQLQSPAEVHLAAAAATDPVTESPLPGAPASAEMPLAIDTSATSASAAEEPPAQPASLAGLRVEISNGNGVRGMAAWLRGWLGERGMEGRPRLTNLRPYATPTTVVQYRAGYAWHAREIARRMPIGVEVIQEQVASRSAQGVDLRVVLGHDMREAAACCGRTPAERVAAAGGSD